MKMKQRETHSRLLLATLVPALVGTGFLADAAQALPTTKLAELPKNSVARVKSFSSSSLDITGAKSLLEQASGSAVDLEVRPEAWNWTRPVTVPRIAQGAAPATTPQTAAEPAEPSDEETDVLDEVNVTATRRPARARDIPSVVYTVKKEDFRAQNATTVTDALSLVPGFQAAPALGGVRNAAAVFLRGFDDKRFQVLKDGLPLERPSNGRSDVSRFQVEELERIEVVTGGATLRYGSGAIGGVINLITETPKGPPKLTLQYQGGSYGFNKFVAKYGGGDDTFSYNFVYTGIVAPNRYPFQITNPGVAQIYGPNDFAKNPGCPADTDPTVGCANGGFPDGTPLFGFVKPEVGPATTASGTADASNAASDTYTGKLVFKPDPSNRITARITQQNSSTESNSPGVYTFSPCVGGPSLATNGTLTGDRAVPVDASGREVGCSPNRFVFNTASAGLSLTFPYNTSFNGKTVFPPGQAYLGAEPLTGNIDFFQQNNQSQTEAAVQWDYTINPTTSLNSFIYYYRFGSANAVPPNYIYNSNIGFGIAGPNGDFGIVQRNPAAQPFASGDKFVAETALNWQISPGQTLTFGINFTEDRSYQEKQRGRSFLDRSIARTSIFLIDDISFSDLVKANVGLRYTSSSQFGEVLTPGVGLRVTPLSWLSFRANWNYVFNAPKISDLYVQNGPFIANPNLRPESGVAVDAGVDITPASNLFFRATYFNIYLDGFFGNQFFANPNFNNPNDTTGTSDFPILQQVQNLKTLISTGIEFQGQWQITDQFSLLVNWTNTDSRAVGQTDSIFTNLFLYQIQNAGIPFNNVGFRLTYANKGLIAAFVGRYLDGFVIDYNNTRTPSFFTLDFNSEIPITPYFTLLGSVFNIFDTQYQNPAGLPAPGTTFTVGGRLEIGG